MSTALQLHLHHDRGVPVVVVTGDVDLCSSAELRHRGAELADLALTGKPPAGDAHGVTRAADVLVLDVTGVAFVDSSGPAALVAVLKRVMAHRAGLSIAGASDRLEEMLRLMGLDKVVMLHATPADAVADAVGGAAPG